MTKKSVARRVRVSNDVFIGEVARMLKEEGRSSVTFVVRGVSMHPFLADGRDKVVLVPPMPPRVGQVVLAEVSPGVFALHRIIKTEGDIVTMRGDGNLLWRTETFTSDKIIGTAKAFIRKGRYVPTDGRLWKCYSAVWHALRPVRRIIVAFYRRIILKF